MKKEEVLRFKKTNYCMPPRFVEVLDVNFEANNIFNSIATKATGIALNLKLNISDYINETSGLFDARIVSVLEQYNITANDVYEAMNVLNLKVSNTSFVHIDRPRPIPAYLMAIGVGLLVVHLALVNVQAKRFVREFGSHA